MKVRIKDQVSMDSWCMVKNAPNLCLYRRLGTVQLRSREFLFQGWTSTLRKPKYNAPALMPQDRPPNAADRPLRRFVRRIPCAGREVVTLHRSRAQCRRLHFVVLFDNCLLLLYSRTLYEHNAPLLLRAHHGPFGLARILERTRFG